MYDLEGINKVASDTQRSMELSESAKDYFNEVIPTAEEWNSMSESEKTETWNLIESRMQEVCDLSGVLEADVAKHIPQYIFGEVEYVELPFCDEEEYFTRGEWAVKEFWERDPYRDISYSDADVNLRQYMIEDFYDSFSEFSGNNPQLTFKDMESNEMGAYNPENNTITLNSKLLRMDNPDELMSTILHESRHAHQQYAVDHPDKVSVSEETIAEWKENMDYYIRPEWDFEAYINQPIENDADKFAENVIQGGYSYLS